MESDDKYNSPPSGMADITEYLDMFQTIAGMIVSHDLTDNKSNIELMEKSLELISSDGELDVDKMLAFIGAFMFLFNNVVCFGALRDSSFQDEFKDMLVNHVMPALNSETTKVVPYWD